MDCSLKSVLITGATGFVGSELIRLFINQPELGVSKIYAIIRGRVGHTAERRWQDLVRSWLQLGMIDERALHKVVVLDIDLTERFDFADAIDVDCVFHCAASTDFSLPLSRSRMLNVDTTKHLVDSCRRLKSMQRFVYISTAFVNSTSRGFISEAMRPTSFCNAYEQSKFEAEEVVCQSGLPYTILRPSVIVGDSRDGYVRGFKVFYALLRLWLSGRLSRMPLSERVRIDLVPIDYVLQCTVMAAKNEWGRNEIFHVTLGTAAVSPVMVMRQAFAVFGLPPPKFIPQWVAYLLAHRWMRPLLGRSLREIVERMHWYLPYLGSRNRFFINDKLLSRMHGSEVTRPDVSQYGTVLFEFCRNTRWGRQAYVRD